MIDTVRKEQRDQVAYDIAFPEHGVEQVLFAWPVQIDATLAGKIIELMRCTSATAPIIGYAQEISQAEAAAYMAELRASLAAHKCRLLTIFADTGLLIGLCTLRRNFNPNNRHITDLAKGMIRESFRGGTVLPAAFHEIALQCEADGVDVVTLDVRADTPAHRAWERFGFKTWGVLPCYARAEGKVHAGHFMMQAVAELKARAIAAFRQAGRKRTRGDSLAAA